MQNKEKENIATENLNRLCCRHKHSAGVFNGFINCDIKSPKGYIPEDSCKNCKIYNR